MLPSCYESGTRETPRPALAVAVAVYSISYAGLRRALDDFENWDLGLMDNQQFFSMSQDKLMDRMRQNIGVGNRLSVVGNDP